MESDMCVKPEIIDRDPKCCNLPQPAGLQHGSHLEQLQLDLCVGSTKSQAPSLSPGSSSQAPLPPVLATGNFLLVTSRGSRYPGPERPGRVVFPKVRN